MTTIYGAVFDFGYNLFLFGGLRHLLKTRHILRSNVSNQENVDSYSETYWIQPLLI